MAGSRSIKKIGILGHVGNKNLGDEAILAAVIQNVKRRYPGAEIYGFTLNPEDTKARHGITAFPIRKIKGNHERPKRQENVGVPPQKSNEQVSLRKLIITQLKSLPQIYMFLKKVQKSLPLIRDSIKEPGFLISCYKALKGIDLLIIAGSQQLIDFIGGAWGHPYTLFRWSMLGKAAKAKVIFLSVGAGPIRSSLSKIFIKASLSQASYRSYRDESSKKLIEQIGVKGSNPVFPDLVYSLRSDGQTGTLVPSENPLPIVGINPVPFSDPVYWPGSSAYIYESYVKKLSDFALWLIGRGYRILFFPTQLNLDPPVIRDIRLCMGKNAGLDFQAKIIYEPVNSFDDLVSSISMTSVVVACRFHGVIIPYLLNKPVLGIAYHRKTFELMEQMGQSEYALDIHSFNCNSLQERFISLESNSVAIRKEIEEKIMISRQALESQYNQVLRLLEEEKSQGC